MRRKLFAWHLKERVRLLGRSGPSRKIGFGISARRSWLNTSSINKKTTRQLATFSFQPEEKTHSRPEEPNSKHSRFSNLRYESVVAGTLSNQATTAGAHVKCNKYSFFFFFYCVCFASAKSIVSYRGWGGQSDVHAEGIFPEETTKCWTKVEKNWKTAKQSVIL